MQKLVKKTYTNPPLTNKSLHNDTNNNGIKIIKFAVSEGLNARSTTFQHKDINKET